MKEDRILPTEAAAIMGTSPQYVRVGLQTGQLDIGSAVKLSSIWTYNIPQQRLEAFLGRDITMELMELRKRNEEAS